MAILQTKQPVKSKLEQNHLINCITDKTFSISDSNSGETFSLNVSFKGANSRWRNWGREYLIQWANGYTDSKLQTLSARKSSIEMKRNQIAKLITWATINKPDASLASWTEEDVFNLLKDIVFNNIQTPERKLSDSSLQFVGKDTVLKAAWHITNSGNLYRKGLLSDGYLGPSNFESILSEFEHDLTLLECDFKEWIKGGSYDSVPLEVASLLLLEAMNTIHSDEAKAVRAYFSVQRSALKLFPESVFKKGNTIFNQVVSGEAINKQFIQAAKRIENFLEAVQAQFKSLKGSKDFDPVDFVINLGGHKQLNNKVKEIYDACKIIFFCLTGIRVHEMKQTDSQDYYKDDDGVWRFKTKEDKTQQGTKQLRAIGGLAAEAADILCDVSYITKHDRKDGQSTYLFGYYTAMKTHFGADEKRVVHDGAGVSRENFRDRLIIFFNKVVDKFGDTVLDEYRGIYPHAFRHSFVDFVLRRFDGNIHEAIRNHFRHCVNGEFTNTYTDSKAQDQIEFAAQQKYMAELVFEMVGEHSQDFTGPIALFIQREVSKFEFVTEEDIGAYINELKTDLLHVVPHEYGYCLVLKSRQHLAKCLDKKTGIAKVLNGCFELCSGCPNSLHNKASHKENIIRNVISHESFLEKFPIKNTPQSEVSKKVVQNGNKILAEMEN
ncbi:site-specific integrase [Pseudoalteromonas sp. SM9913]|uniref:site-specific integrase n=1 Tax=Pseudoalteromonas sp. (strain SM9913) TaxID=234831 RepID=UPI0001EF88FB|nr:site-specific integrase [Pseudoalteromonas sp. SM9913]ADT67633.1 conserved hypothetical protein [Pseudoalteromonas sp. SM9913]